MSNQVLVTSEIKKDVPGNQIYAEATRNIRKIGLIRDIRIERLNKRHFNQKINGKVYFFVFWDANIKCLHHFIQPTLHKDKGIIH